MDEALEALWMQYRETGSGDALNRLTLHYAPLVKFAYSRVSDGSPAMMATGLDSLRGAIETFDNGNGQRFEHHFFGMVTTDDVDVPIW